MIKKHPVSTSIVAALVITNGALAYQYNKETNNLKDRLNEKTAEHNELHIEYGELNSHLEKQNGKIEEYKRKIIENNKRFKSLNEKLKQQEKNINKLQKQSNKPEVKKEVSRPPQSKVATFEVTGFTSGYESTQKRKGDPGYGITASGKKVREGVTAACPKSMPFGTVLEIEKVGKRVCEDRGSAIVAGHLDVYFDDLSVAKTFGRKKLKVKIIGG